MPKVTRKKKVIDEVSGVDKSVLFSQRVEEMRKKDKEKEVEKERKSGQFHKEKAAAVVKSMVEDRRRYDSEWMTRDLFRRGYQFSNYNSTSRTISIASRSSVKVPINLTWAQMRSIRNQVTSFRPKWETLPKGKNQEAMANARYSGRLLDYYYDRLGLRHMVKETVTQGLVYSVGGPWQVGYDPHADNGKGEVFIWLLDPYDFYIDSSATCIEDAEFCCKAVRRPLDEVRNNPEFSFYDDTLSGESRMAVSEYKQFLLQTLKQTQTGKAEEEEGVIVYEVYTKERVNEVNKEKLAQELRENKQDASKLRVGEVLMRNVFYVDSLMDPLKVQLLRRSDFPFVSYHADINPKEFYGESWIKHLIPVNRLLNALESSVFEYNYRYGKGRFVLDKNSGVKLISNRHGDFIEVNPGHQVTSVALSPLPASYAQQISNCWRYLEDIGGSHDICVSDDSEALTKEGWKKREELKVGEDIYTINPETLDGEWNEIKTLHQFEKKDESLYKIENKNISALVTENHRWLVKTEKGVKFVKTPELNEDSFIPLKTGFVDKDKLSITRERYTGTVWCPETKNSTWMMRRNGKVCFTGNSLGRIPAGVKSGVGIAELKAADATNQSDLVDNLEDFLVNVGKKVLNEIADNYSIPKLVKDLGMGGKVSHFAIVGEEAGSKRQKQDVVKIGVDQLPLAVIGKDSEVRVTVGSWLAYTKSAREEKLKELFSVGLLDQRSVLEHLEFSDIDNIVQQTREEGVLSKQRKQAPPGEEGVSDEEIARSENQMMLGGQEVPVEITDNHNIHRIVHQEALGMMGNPLVETHISEHDQLLKAGPKEGVRDMMSQSAPAPSAAGMPAPEGVPQGPPGPGGPPGLEGPAPEGQPVSPEQAALQESLSGIIGG